MQSLCDHGPLSLPHLAERLGRDSRGVGLVVASLAKRGLVEKRAVARGPRARLLSVTLAGRAASHRSSDREVAALVRALAAWPHEEGQRLDVLLTSLARALDTGRAP